MACSITINGRAFPCKTGIGGIKRVWAAAYADDLWEAIAAGAVADAAASLTMRSFELTKNSGSLEQTVTSSVENGTIFYSQVVTMVMPVLTPAANAEISDLLSARVALVVEDNNGNLLIMGYSLGCEATGGTIGTGTGKGDMNGYSIQFTAEEQLPAPFVTAGYTDLVLTPAT